LSAEALAKVEAIQNLSAEGLWIASSQPLLAMTEQAATASLFRLALAGVLPDGLHASPPSSICRFATLLHNAKQHFCGGFVVFDEIARFAIRTLRSRYRDQKAELRAFRRHIRSGDVVCDVGANKGSYIYWLARWCGEGRLVAFEPQPSLARRLSKLCAALRLRNVVVEPKAVYSSNGELELFVPEGHQPGASLLRPSGQFTAVRVPTVSLDSYFDEQTRISAIKIDVEGAEFDVLKGAERILRHDRPLIVVECENRHQSSGTVYDLFSYLRALGYSGCFINGDKVLPIEQFDVAVHQRQDGEWFWKSPGYCHNFIFEPAEEQNNI
jgi:FkbM family methyltransferase